MLVLSASKVIGVGKFFETIRIAPLASLLYIWLAVLAYVIGIRQKANIKANYSKAFIFWAWVLLILSLVPSFAFFLVLLIVMIIVSIVFLSNKKFRQALVI